MAIQYPSYQIDPRMVPNFQGLGDFLNNAYKGYQMASLPEQQKAEKQAQDLKNQLVTAQTQSAVLKNKYTPQQMQDEQQLNAAQISNLGAQTSLTGAKTGLTNEQISELKAQNEQQRRFNTMLQGAYGNQGAQQSTVSPISSSQMNSIPMSTQGQSQPQTNGTYLPGAQVLNPGDQNLYGVDALYSQHPEFRKQLEDAGFGVKTQVMPNKTNGQLMSVVQYPSGRQEVVSQQIGPSPRDVAFEQGIGSEAVNAYKTSTANLNTLYDNQQKIDSIKSDLSDPALDDAVGPLNSWYQARFGKDATGKLFGDLESNTNSLVASMAQGMGSRAMASQIALAKTMKPSTKDTRDVLIGKANAVNSMNKWQIDYNKAVNENIKNGMLPDDAYTEASKQVPFDKYKEEILNDMNEANKASQLKQKGVTITYRDGKAFFVADRSNGYKVYPIDSYDDWAKISKGQAKK